MLRKLWNKCQGGVCALDFYSYKGIRFDSFSGFKHDKYLITDDSVLNMDKSYEVLISFYEEDGLTIKESVKITYKDFKQRTLKGIDGIHKGFTLIDIDFPQFDNIPSLQFSNVRHIPIASPIAIIAHQWEQNNIAIKSGIISSNYMLQGQKMIMFDVSLDRGNAGAPLLDPTNGEVIGIVGRRLDMINKEYKKIIEIINTNIQLLKQSEGKVIIHDIDPIQVLIANQNQIKRLAQELLRKVSLTHGYAVCINHIAEFFDISELEKDIVNISIEKLDRI